MSRIAYVNGRYRPLRSAAVNVEDRGFQFADGVYEVIAVVDGRCVDLAEHFNRLDRSLAALRIPQPMSRAVLSSVVEETARRNRVGDGLVYLQISRGVARRDHPFPTNAKPTLVVTARRHVLPKGREDFPGVRVVTARDIRWARCDIKSISLLPNVLAKQEALDKGAFDVWMVDGDGLVSEGSSSNAWIIDGRGTVVTRPTGPEILGGITRDRIISLAREDGVEVVERPFTVGDAKAAREAFLTSTTTFLRPVICIDDAVIGSGEVGTLSQRLLDLYITYARKGIVCR
jgi:D-alanine transaminase